MQNCRAVSKAITGYNFANKSMRIFAKNENIACWIDDHFYATVLDLVCLFGSETGVQISNPDCLVGQEVSVVSLPSPDVVTTPKCLEIFGPKIRRHRSSISLTYGALIQGK